MKAWLYFLCAAMAATSTYALVTTDDSIISFALGMASGVFFVLARREP